MKRASFILFSYLILACADNDIPIDCSKSDLALTLISVTNATGCVFRDGAIKIGASGGNEPYQYAIQNQPFQASGDFINIGAGIYSFIVKDKSGCEAELNNIVLMASDFGLTIDVVENTKCVGGNGVITVSIIDGLFQYQYKLDDGVFGNNNVFSGLEAGSYLITVKNNVDCITELNIVVQQGVTNTSWSNEILPIIQTSCAVTGCHNGIARTDLRVYANAKFYATLIKTYTQSGYMPFEGTINQDKKDLIACWVDEGAVEN